MKVLVILGMKDSRTESHQTSSKLIINEASSIVSFHFVQISGPHNRYTLALFTKPVVHRYSHIKHALIWLCDRSKLTHAQQCGTCLNNSEVIEYYYSEVVHAAVHVYNPWRICTCSFYLHMCTPVGPFSCTCGQVAS